MLAQLRRLWVWYLVGLAGVVVLVHWPLLGSFFVEDDVRSLYIGSRLQDWWALLYDREVAVEVNNYFYRPLIYFSLWLDWRLFGLNPIGYHLHALALLLAAALLLVGLLRRVSQDALWPWIAGALLAFSPPATATAAWLSAAHMDLLGGALYLGSLVSFVRHCQGGSHGWYLLSLILAAAGLLSKEAMASLPLVLLMVDRAMSGGRPLGARLLRLLPFFGLLAAYLALRAYMLDGLGGYPYLPITLSSYLDRLWRLPMLLISQMSALFPIAGTAATIAGAALLASLLVRSPSRLLFHTVLFLLMLAPTIHLLGSSVSGPRYFFMPALAVAVALADALRVLLRSASVGTRVGAILAGLIIATSSLASSWHIVQDQVVRSQSSRPAIDAAWRTLHSAPPAAKMYFVYEGSPWVLSSNLLLMALGSPLKPFAVLRPAPYLASWGLAERLSKKEGARVLFYDGPTGKWQDRSRQALEELQHHLALRRDPAPVLTVHTRWHRLSLRWEGASKSKPVHLYVGKEGDRGIYSEELVGYPAEGISALLSGGRYELAVAFQEDSGVESQMAVASVRIESGIEGGPLVPDHFM